MINIIEIIINKIREYSIDEVRSVLVIFKYIKEINEMYDLLIKKNIPKQVQTFNQVIIFLFN